MRHVDIRINERLGVRLRPSEDEDIEVYIEGYMLPMQANEAKQLVTALQFVIATVDSEEFQGACRACRADIRAAAKESSEAAKV